MSRRASTTVLHVSCSLIDRAGHNLGQVFLALPPHPEAGKYLLGKGVTFLNHDGALGGKVAVHCDQCRLDEQVAWRRVHARLCELHDQGRHAGRLQIHRD